MKLNFLVQNLKEYRQNRCLIFLAVLIILEQLVVLIFILDYNVISVLLEEHKRPFVFYFLSKLFENILFRVKISESFEHFSIHTLVYSPSDTAH